MRAINQQKQIKLYDDKIAIFEKDIWKNEELGFKPDTVHGMYQLNFTRLKPEWFKHAVKRFIYFQSSVKSFSTCFSYLGRLITFGEFLSEKYPYMAPADINREFIVKYIEFLARSKLGIVTRSMSLIHLRTFHSILIQENWLPWPKEPLIYSSDLPKNHEHIPKFIPEFVVSQLQMKLHHLPIYICSI